MQVVQTKDSIQTKRTGRKKWRLSHGTCYWTEERKATNTAAVKRQKIRLAMAIDQSRKSRKPKWAETEESRKLASLNSTYWAHCTILSAQDVLYTYAKCSYQFKKHYEECEKEKSRLLKSVLHTNYHAENNNAQVPWLQLRVIYTTLKPSICIGQNYTGPPQRSIH